MSVGSELHKCGEGSGGLTVTSDLMARDLCFLQIQLHTEGMWLMSKADVALLWWLGVEGIGMCLL